MKSIKVWPRSQASKVEIMNFFGLFWPVLDFGFILKLKPKWGLFTYYIQVTKVHTDNWAQLAFLKSTKIAGWTRKTWKYAYFLYISTLCKICTQLKKFHKKNVYHINIALENSFRKWWVTLKSDWYQSQRTDFSRPWERKKKHQKISIFSFRRNFYTLKKLHKTISVSQVNIALENSAKQCYKVTLKSYW